MGNHINMKYFILVAALAAVAVADHGPVHAPVHHAPVHHAPVHHEPSYHAPAPKHHGNSYHEPQYKPSEAHYAYKYGVDAQDPYKGYVNFGAEEARDGYSGNVMDVQYEGKASYHEPAPHHAAPHKAPA